jgi:hypothetical protein
MSEKMKDVLGVDVAMDEAADEVEDGFIKAQIH